MTSLAESCRLYSKCHMELRVAVPEEVISKTRLEDGFEV